MPTHHVLNTYISRGIKAQHIQGLCSELMMNGNGNGVMISILAIGPKVRGFKPGRGRWIFKGDKNQWTDFYAGEVKPSAPCFKSSWRVKEPCVV
jgi:hypothetical protein